MKSDTVHFIIIIIAFIALGYCVGRITSGANIFSFNKVDCQKIQPASVSMDFNPDGTIKPTEVWDGVLREPISFKDYGDITFGEIRTDEPVPHHKLLIFCGEGIFCEGFEPTEFGIKFGEPYW